MNHPLEISPTKVRPSEVDAKVCKGILDEINQASPEPEKVWRMGILVKPPGRSNGERWVFTTEAGAWRARNRVLSDWPGEYTDGTPYKTTIQDALSEPPHTTSIRALVLLDEEGREVRRWVLP